MCDSEPLDESIQNIIRAAGQDPTSMSRKTIKFVYDFIENYKDDNVHKAHVGWDQDNGFSNNMCDSEPLDESIQNIIRAAGQDPTSMSRKTIKFVYDFIENYKDDNVSPTPAQPYKPPAPVAPQWSSPTPPPPPSRTASHQAPARPPPPPPALTSGRPIAVTHSAPPAPPPPPSMSSEGGRGNLLAEIQAGKQLRSVAAQGSPNAGNEKGAGDTRGNVMAQIRQGAQLKHVDTTAEQEKRRSENTSADMGGIAGALAKALEERRMNMALDDSSEEEESDDKNEWSD
ncbi:hypothetical protein TELCIR_02553 [Teladorsagia circumcincta]|uniref:WH2 domain-containing protein n=1 Tax=Teladorsagia circumcincta TaxID=45464 RepID=A0A2G9UYR4_TELCI|nr:hypothetical protein TELCIR_02553 [Teladorsagia circumcincta]